MRKLPRSTTLLLLSLALLAAPLAAQARPALGVSAAPGGAFGAAATATPPAGAPGDAVSLFVDDGVAEDAIGVNGAGASYQFVWLNRFTPEPSAFPFMLEEVSVVIGNFDPAVVGGTMELVVWQDTDGDGDPATGSSFLYSENVTVQYADGATWNVYALATPVRIDGPGDVLVGAINRWVTSGVTPPQYPAAIDATASQARSWCGWWDADPPEPPALPPDSLFGTIDGLGFAGNWMIRAAGHGAGGDVLLGTTGNASGTSTLVSLDPTTGGLAGTIGDVGYLVNGLHFEPRSGVLYATTSSMDATFPDGLIAVDLNTAAGTPIGPAGMKVTNVRADSRGRLFAWTEDGDDLVSIDPSTGAATVVGDSGISSLEYGMAFDAADRLWFVNGGDWMTPGGPGDIYTVDALTGAGTFTGGSLGTLAHHGDFDPGTGLFWGIDTKGSGTKNLVVADLQTGTVVGSLPTVDDLHTLTFVDVPRYRIRGRVRTVFGLPISRVSMRLTYPDGSFLKKRTNRRGRYAFINLAEGTYVLKPRKAGYAFRPRRKTVVIDGADLVRGFRGTPLW